MMRWMDSRSCMRLRMTADDVRFSFGMPYVQADLDRFLASYVDSDYLVAETLCETPQRT